MNFSSADIENVVRKVLATLSTESARDPGGQLKEESKSPIPSDSFLWETSVASVDAYRRVGSVAKCVELYQGTVITPSFKEYCREKRVEIKLRSRGLSADLREGVSHAALEMSQPKRPQRLIVAGTSKWLDAVSKQLCPKQAAISKTSSDDTAALHAIQRGIRDGHQAGVLLVDSAYATLWQAARDETLRPVVLSQWSEFQDMMGQVPANLIILQSSKWNVPSVCNVARKFFDHLNRN